MSAGDSCKDTHEAGAVSARSQEPGQVKKNRGEQIVPEGSNGLVSINM